MVSNGKSFVSGKLFDGHYRLIRLLSDKNSTVAIWLARDLNTIDRNASANNESSAKLVSIMICHPATALDIEDEQRWQDEFDAAHDCRHPNLIPPDEYAIFNEAGTIVAGTNMVNYTTGRRKALTAGNAYEAKSVSLTLPKGNYTYAVQAVSTAFQGSPFATGSFEIESETAVQSIEKREQRKDNK